MGFIFIIAVISRCIVDEIKDYLLEDYRETNVYTAKLWRSGLSSFPPLIVTCAITGGNAGKEVNPNLPESLEEQVKQTYDAYNAGASMVHVHRRDPENPAEMTRSADDYREVNIKIREKCPDIIINNTCACGRLRIGDSQEWSPQLLTSMDADPEIASLDISCYCSLMRLPKREPPLFGRDQEIVREMSYAITQTEAEKSVELMREHGIKPEFECFAMSDLHYVNRLVQSGYVDLNNGPHLIQFVFTTGSNWPTAQYLSMVVNAVPNGCILGIIAPGAMQFPVLAMAIVQGLHVRVGMEDNVYIERGQKAGSNAELVEKIIRIATELGRPIATPAQARQMLGLGGPRKW
jgi:3-keto-5-aminohexanoate cleavage enzyme